MPFTLTMPKMSPTMEAGAIAKWHKKEGEHVDAGELLIEVATDKATVEYNAIDAGWIRKILMKEGDEAQVNQAIAIMTESENDNIEGYQPEGIKIEVPPEVKSQTDSESSQPSTQQLQQPQQPQQIKAGLSQPAFVPEAPLENTKVSFAVSSTEGRILASPLTRKIAKDKGLDLSSVKGSGPNDRIMSRDLELAQATSIVNFGPKSQPDIAAGSYEEEPLTQIRKITGLRLQEAKTFIPHFYVSLDINAAALVEVREQLRQGEVKVTYNDFVIRACSLALREHPNVNSGFNSTTHSIIRFKTIDISVAVSVPAGLITPIIRYADYKNVGQLSVEMRALAKKAKDGKLAPQEYKGGSFTISNLGMFGVDDFIAIINPPQAAILAVSGIQEKPVVKSGQVVPGHVMRITLSADHRVIDGAAGAAFVKTIQKYLENPALLLI